MSISVEKVTTDRFEMNYFRFGGGEKTMVILPGLSVQSVMGFADSVAAEYEVMTKDFTVYVFDRRLRLPPSYSIRQMAQDTTEAFRALGLRDIHLFGASQGGMIAMEIAAGAPDLIARLALGSTSPRISAKRYRALKNWMELAARKDGVGLYLAFGRKLYPSGVFEQFRESLASAGKTVTDEELERFAILAGGSKGFNATGRLKRIQCPVLAIGSLDDEVIGPEGTALIAKKLGKRPDFETYMYEGFGHAAYDTAPDYRDRLCRFFSR